MRTLHACFIDKQILIDLAGTNVYFKTILKTVLTAVSLHLGNASLHSQQG